ncbi:hypothetical protein K1719_046666 [Acacia pycnantha]|nr:hypothetical protein K1719_046666 [Acacia pycnantha]
MEPESAIPPALDDNGDKELSMKLSISELISNLRTAFRKADYDHVEEVLVSKETKLKNKIKILTDKLELERMEKMSVQDELRKQCKMRKDAKERYDKLLEALKKDNDLDDEKHRAGEFWKKNFEVLKERLKILEKAANFMGDDGEAEELFGLQGNNDPGVSINGIGKKDMNHVDVCDKEPQNFTTGLPPSQRKDLKSVNTHLSFVEVTRQSPDSLNMAVIGTSDIEQQENNEADIDDHECKTIAAGTSSQRKTDDCGNTHLAVDDDSRQSPDNPNTAVLETTKNAVDVHDHECGNTAADTSPSLKKKEDCGNTHLIDDSRQSPDTPYTAVLGPSARIENSVDVHDHDSGNIAADTPPSHRKADDCRNTYLAVNDNARQSPNTDVLGASETTTEDAIDVHDHECGHIAANTATYQRQTDDCGNTHLAVDDDARQSPDTPNTALLGALKATSKNAVDMHDHECGNTIADTSPSHRKKEDCGNTHLAVDDDSRLSPDTSNTAVLGASEATTKNSVDVHDHECGNTAADTPPSERKADDCKNTHLAVNDDARQSPNTPNTAVLGASANASLVSQKIVIEIMDSDDDDCIASGALNAKKATCDIAAAADLSGSGIVGPLKRKWFPALTLDGSDTDDDSSSSTSSLESGINKVQLPSDFLCSISCKMRKT